MGRPRQLPQAESEIISLRLPKHLVESLDILVAKGIYQNRADAIREGIRMIITKYYDAITDYRLRNAKPEVGLR